MKNKIFAVILTVCMIITMIPVGVFGDEKGPQGENNTTVEVPVFSTTSIDNISNLKFDENSVASVTNGESKSITGYLYIATKSNNNYISFRELGDGEAPYITYSTSENSWPEAKNLTYEKNSNGSYTFTYTGTPESGIGKNKYNYIGYAIGIKKNGTYVGNGSIYIEYSETGGQSQGESEQPSADKTYEIRFDKLEDPADYTDRGDRSEDKMWHLGQGTEAIFNTKITHQYTCFYVVDKATDRDARGFADERVYIGSLSDFVIEAKEKNGGNWNQQNKLDERYRVFGMTYEAYRKGFNNVFKMTFDLSKDNTNKATEKYEYRLRYTGNDKYLRNGNQNNLFVLNLKRDEQMVEFDIDEARYDGVDKQGNKIFNEGNVQYFDKKGDYIDTKLVIRPGVMQSAADKKVYDSSYNIEIENEVENIKFCRYNESGNQWVALTDNESPFTVTWDETNRWYHIVYNPDNDFYGPEYAMRYTGDYNTKINEKYKYESGTTHTVANQSAFWTGKSTTYAESNTVNATLGDNVDKKRISTIGVIFRSGKVDGNAQIDITTDEGKITLGGSLSNNIGSVSASDDVSFEMRDLQKDDYGLKDAKKEFIKKCEKAFDFKITSNNGNVAFGDTGYAKIEIPCDMQGMAIYYIDDEGNKTLVSSTYENGKIKFTANHFSTYVVAPAESTGGSTTGGGSIVVAPAADEVKTTTDGNITATIKDVKTETVKNESGQEITKTTATVSAATANKLVNQAVSDKSEVIEVTVKSDSQTKVNGEKSTELEIPKSAVESIVKNTDASLVVKTDSGEVTLDNKTLETIASEADGEAVRIVVNENTQLKEEQKSAADVIGDKGMIFDLSAMAGNKQIHDFKGGKAHINIPVPEKLKGKDVVVVYINDKGICEILNHTMQAVGADSFIKFTTTHFSTFAVVEKADADKLIARQNDDKVKTLIKEVSLKATTTGTSKKNIKVKVAETDKTGSMINEIEAMGYTVKYRFCRSTKASTGYIGKKTKSAASWTNTSGKKGAKYYYRAKAYVYDGNTLIAKTALKQCKYSVRTWSK